MLSPINYMDKTSRVHTNKRRNSWNILDEMDGMIMFQKIKNGVAEAVKRIREVLDFDGRRKKLEQAMQEAAEREAFIAKVAESQDMSSVFAQCCVGLGFIPELHEDVPESWHYTMPELIAPKLERTVL